MPKYYRLQPGEKDYIIDFLSKNRKWLTIDEIAKGCGLERERVEVHIKKLVEMGLIAVRVG